jgi:putative N6-adenine-specific DNA methylase
METFAALCAAGAERVTANELRKLGFSVPDTGYGRVRFQTDIPGCYRALMALRTADRVLWEAARFPAPDFDALFEGTRAAPWERFIPPSMGVRIVKARTSRSSLRGTVSIQGVVNRAVAEKLCAAHHLARLPEGPDADMANIRVYLEKDEALLLLDLSGEPLSRRGYRLEGGEAPLRETTACALLFLADWRRKYPLYDPFCGSGTIAIEAAMFAWDMAPGLGRRFSLSGMLPADGEVERALREELLGRVNFEHTIRIAGSDAGSRAVAMAENNLARVLKIACGKDGTRNAPPGSALPVFAQCPMERAKPPESTGGDRGFLITNPPYGIRLGGTEDAEANYGAMAVLRKNFSGWKMGIITVHRGFESNFGKKADARREIVNGAEGAYFFQYEKL